MLPLFTLMNTLIFAPLTAIQIVIGFIIYLLGQKFKSRKLKTHGINLAIAGDQNMNVIWLGHPDETISSRCGRAELSGRPKWYIKYFLRPFVDWAARRFGDGPNHCIRAIEYDEVQKYEVWKWHI